MSTHRFTDSTLEACAYFGYIFGGITLVAAGVFFARDGWFPSGELSPQPVTLAALLSAPGEPRWITVSGFEVVEDYIVSDPAGKTQLILLPTTAPNPDAPRALVATVSAFTSEDALTREEINTIVKKQALTGKFEGIAFAEGKLGNLLQVKYRGLGGQGVAVLKCNTPGTRNPITNPKLLGIAAALLLVGGLVCHLIDRGFHARAYSRAYGYGAVQSDPSADDPSSLTSRIARRVTALAFISLGTSLTIGLFYAVPKLLTRHVALADLLVDGATPEPNVTVSGFRIADVYTLDDHAHYAVLLPRDDSPGTPPWPLVVLFDYPPDPDDLADYESRQSLRGEFQGRVLLNAGVERRLHEKLGIENGRECAYMKGPPNPAALRAVWAGLILGAVMVVIRLVVFKRVPLWNGNR